MFQKTRRLLTEDISGACRATGRSASWWCRIGCLSLLFMVSLLTDRTFAVVTLELGKTNGSSAFPLTNGRQIGRNAEGIWFVAYDGTSEGKGSIFLAASRNADPELAGDFHPAIAIAGAVPQAVIQAGREARLASFVIDREDVLHLVWQSSEPQALWYSRCTVKGKEPASQIALSRNWTHSDGATRGAERIETGRGAKLGDLALDAQGGLWITYSQLPAAQPESFEFQSAGWEYSSGRLRGVAAEEIWIATPSRGSWRRKPLTRAGLFTSPVIDLDASGTLHAVFWKAPAWNLFYLQVPEFASRFESTDLTRNLPDSVWGYTEYTNYTVVGWGSRALVVFETVEHVIVYAYFDGQDWVRRPLHPGTKEAYHRPILARDGHDVAWVFWSNTTRGHTFYSRWLGERFSAPYECRGLPGDPSSHIDSRAESRLPTLADVHTVQKQMSPGTTALGLAITSTGPSGAVFFDQLIVPGLKAEKGRKVLFLDMLEVSAVEGLVETFHPMKKHPANPVLRQGQAGSWDSRRADVYGEVLYDQGKFRMWYSGAGYGEVAKPQAPFPRRNYIGYAESQDGVHWVKPKLNQFEHRGSKANNILNLDYGGESTYMPLVVKDELEAAPERRYKMVVEQRRGNTLHFSADGLRWRAAALVNPRYLPDSSQRNPEWWGDRRNLFYDPLEKIPDRRWKVYTHCSGMPDLVRKTCRHWSPDLFHWTPDPRNPVMHPRAGAEVEQHLTSVWPYAGLYVGMFDAWNPVQLQQQQLVASRDGVNFVHVFDGQYVIETGKPGEWDAGWTSPANVPVEVGDEIWYYYSGHSSFMGTETEWNLTPLATGLATIRRDGFVSLDVEAGRGRGQFLTIPFETTRGTIGLEVNAEGLSEGAGRLYVQVGSGYTVVATSHALTEDGVRVTVLWPNGGGRLALPPGEKLQLRFLFEGQARVYSFSFQ